MNRRNTTAKDPIGDPLVCLTLRFPRHLSAVNEACVTRGLTATNQKGQRVNSACLLCISRPAGVLDRPRRAGSGRRGPRGASPGPSRSIGGPAGAMRDGSSVHRTVASVWLRRRPRGLRDARTVIKKRSTGDRIGRVQRLESTWRMARRAALERGISEDVRRRVDCRACSVGRAQR